MAFTHTAEDEQAIRQAALDYIESQHNVDRGQLERSVHPRLVKRTFWTDTATRKQYLDEMSLEQLALVAESYNVDGTRFPANPKKEVEIFDICGSIASVKLIADEWVDYMHIIKLNGEWKVVNVLWGFNDPSRHGPK
ncbi:MAG: nuclear transport factor 2 family protein [Anaerolineales bacterium]|nr:nuclear transport factor 2 family protein [Anaerolineales bacterium]